ncbi:MAG: DUF4230 domain-containing protein [Bacteroidaceae bacterium]
MKSALSLLYHNRYLIVFCALLLFVVVVYFRCSYGTGPSLSRVKNQIELTAEEITSIQNIQQWEFLSMQTEELLDTTQVGLLTDQQLVRIYRGTLRMGIDLSHTAKNWIQYHGDTASILLPPITLLDTNFIDEANTTTFYEKGSWNAKAKEELYQRARKKMIQRIMTPAHRQQALRNAQLHFTQLFKAYGFQTVEFR